MDFYFIENRSGVDYFFVGCVIAWTWWSFVITKWRIWAFGILDEDEWITLKKKAIHHKLIWEDGYGFEKTEMRNIQDRIKILKINERIFELQQVEDIKTDLLTPPQVGFAFNRTDFKYEVIARLFILLIGITGLFIMTGLSKLLSVFVLLFVLVKPKEWKYLKHFNKKGNLMSINDEGITFLMPHYQFIRWKEIESYTINKELKSLSLYIYNLPKPIHYNLYYFAIRDLNHFSDQLKVFIERNQLKQLEE